MVWQLARGGNWKSNPIYCLTLPSTLELNLLDEGISMAGATHQIQIRHILVEKKEVADFLASTSDRSEAIEELTRVLLLAAEFRFNH